MEELYIRELDEVLLRVPSTEDGDDVIEYAEADDDNWEYPDQVIRTGYYNDLIFLSLNDEMIVVTTEKELQKSYPEVLELIK